MQGFRQPNCGEHGTSEQEVEPLGNCGQRNSVSAAMGRSCERL